MTLPSRNITIGFIAVAVLAVFGFNWFSQDTAMAPSQASADTVTQTEQGNTDTAAVSPTSDTGVIDMTLGAEDAPITIIEYASFTCPHCATFHKDVYPNLKAEYIETGKVKFVFREVYFDRYGLWAGIIARCAGPEKYFGMTQLIFDHQREWASSDSSPAGIVESLKKLGRVAGMNDADMDACMQDQDKAQALVAEFQKNAEADNVQSTPTLIINGETNTNMPFSQLKQILDDALEG